MLCAGDPLCTQIGWRSTGSPECVVGTPSALYTEPCADVLGAFTLKRVDPAQDTLYTLTAPDNQCVTAPADGEPSLTTCGASIATQRFFLAALGGCRAPAWTRCWVCREGEPGACCAGWPTLPALGGCWGVAFA